MSDLERLQTLKSALIEKLADLLDNPKPTYSIDGQSVSWTDHYKFISGQINAVNELILMHDPYFIISQAL